MENIILGIGVDVEEIERFDGKTLKNRNFLKKIFTDSELNYCFAKKYPSPHLAVRFAGKEAVIKSLDGLYKEPIGYNDIEIINDKNGKPSVRIKKSKTKIFISLAHTKNIAIASVVVCK